MPRVSIIIPSFNHAEYLPKRLKSIYEQTYTDYEIIFMDDCSDDDSVRIFHELKNEKCVKEIINKENSGSLYKQWNTGISESRCEYIWIAESDDWSDKEFLKEMISLLDARSDAGMAYCRSNYIDDKDEIINNNNEWAPDIALEFWDNDFIMDGKRFASNYLTLNNVVNNTSSVLIRRQAWEESEPLNEGIKYCGDWIKWAEIARISKVVYLSRRLNYYRHHEGTVRSKHMKGISEILELYEVLMYMQNNFDVPQKILELRLERLCHESVGKVIYNSEHSELEKLKNVYRLYNEIKRYDDSILKRVFQNLAKEYTHKILNKFSSLFKSETSAQNGNRYA